MARTSIYRATAQRLKSYQLFSKETIDAVAAVAEQQIDLKTYQAFFNAVGVSEQQLHVVSKKRGVPVVEIVSVKKPIGTVVLHLPMANPLDENQLYHAATVAAALPQYRIIVFGNPSGKPYSYKEQNGTLIDKFLIAFTKHRRALVDAEINYLRTHGVTHAHYVGYSYGAHKALIESAYLHEDEKDSLTFIDPVAYPRNVIRLARDFKKTSALLGKYVDRTNIPAFLEARRKTDETNHPMMALRRPISIAIALLLSRMSFLPNLQKELAANPTLKVTVAWGGKSELGDDRLMQSTLERFTKEYKSRLRTLHLKDDAHAFGNDIHLFAAIIRMAVLSDDPVKK